MTEGAAANVSPAVESVSVDAGGLGDGAEPSRPVSIGDAPASAESEAAKESTKVEETPEFKRFEELKRRDQKQRAAQRKLDEDRQALERRASEVEARWAEAEKKLKDAQEKLSDYELFEADPLAWAEKYNKDPLELTNRIVTPLSQEQRELRNQKKAIEELNKRIESLLSGNSEAKEAEKRERATREYESQITHLVSSLQPNEYPHVLAFYDGPAEIKASMEALYKSEGPAFVAEYGREPTDKELLSTLENMLGSRITSAEKKRQTFSQSASGSANGTQSNGSATLNNLDASEVSAAAQPKSRQERVEALIARLQAELPDPE